MNDTYDIEDIHRIMSLSVHDFAEWYNVSYVYAQKWLRGADNILKLARWEQFQNILLGEDIDITPKLFRTKVASGTSFREALQDSDNAAYHVSIFSMAMRKELKG